MFPAKTSIFSGEDNHLVPQETTIFSSGDIFFSVETTIFTAERAIFYNDSRVCSHRIQFCFKYCQSSPTYVYQPLRVSLRLSFLLKSTSLPLRSLFLPPSSYMIRVVSHLQQTQTWRKPFLPVGTFLSAKTTIFSHEDTHFL